MAHGDDPALYQFRVNGHLGPTLLWRSRRWFPGSRAPTPCSPACLTAALYGVLAEMEAFGLDLLEVRQIAPQRTSPESGDSRLS